MKLFDYLNTIPKWLGFSIALAFTTIYHLGSLYFGYSITAGWLLLFLIIGGFVAGLRLSVFLAFFISFYTIYAIPNDLTRIIQVVAISFLTSIIIGLYSRYQHYLFDQARLAWIREEQQRRIVEEQEKAVELLKELNGNIVKIKEARLDLDAVLRSYSLPDNARTQLRAISHLLGNLELAADGWRTLHKIIEEVKEAKEEIKKRMG